MLLVLASATQAFAANDIPTVINNTRNWIVGILAGLATLFLTIGGLRYVMAGGDPGEVEKAKGALRAAAIGYALAILAPVLLEILQGIVGTDPAQNPAPPPQEARDA
ncbi:pilin [Yinghuangia sp. ASG 101]|uniref:pilin n=1 Tax=Yinghuangia sp. ASG 101 TaxID=2896848 RepID=UPI001E650CF5|nr:pilin [Yinghuangia sp. ASG 101]UGQ10545.1 pilin [Yinghuangia sp. ASG 101]